MKYVPGKGLCGVPGRAILFFFFPSLAGNQPIFK